MKKRLDKEILQRFNIETRQKAQYLIKSNQVIVNKVIINKNNFLVKQTDNIEIINNKIYVAKSAYKLLYAIKYFKLNLNNLICLDIGCSTGGFCEVLLENNVKKIYAIDVGTNQLHKKLKQNQKIILFENTNFRFIDKKIFNNDKINFIVCDVSFISAKIIIEKILQLFDHYFKMLVLIKPQFELNKQTVKKTKGVILNKKHHDKIIKDFESFFQKHNLKYSNIIAFDNKKHFIDNKEFLVLLEFNNEK